MVREIVNSAKNTYTINLPDEMVGKTVEVIAFEINDSVQKSIVKTPGDLDDNLKSIKQRYSQYPSISHSGYKFNRDEANDYE